MSDAEIEVSRALREGVSKYVYYLLSAAAASIAFSVSQTQASTAEWRHVPIGLAVLFWGISFYCGCRHATHVNAGLHANGQALLIARGKHPEVGARGDVVAAALSGVNKAVEHQFERANRFAGWQFRFFLAGGGAFLVWHVLRMFLRGQ